MQNFVSVILKTKKLDEYAVVEAMMQSLGAPLAEHETEYGLFESENSNIVLRLETPYELDDEESDAFAESFANRMFEMGYDDFEIETSLEEALDAKLNAAIKAINSMGSMWKKVKQGSKNSPEVKTIQQALNKLGFDAGKADGWFGKNTAKAVMAFQKSKGLKVDGDPGPNTLKAMLNTVKDTSSANNQNKANMAMGPASTFKDKDKPKSPSLMTNVQGLAQVDKSVDKSVPKSIANFDKVKTPKDVIKISNDAIEKARQDGNLAQIAQIASASLANMPNIQTPAEKAEIAKQIIAQIDNSELSNPAVKAALAPAQLAVDVADAGTDEAKLQDALEKFTVDVFPEAIPPSIRSKVPPEDVAKRSAEVIIKKAQEEGLMSQFEDPSKAVTIIQAQVEKLSQEDSKKDGKLSSRLDKKGETPTDPGAKIKADFDKIKAEWEELQKTGTPKEINDFLKTLTFRQKQGLRIDPLAKTANDLGLDKKEDEPEYKDVADDLFDAMDGFGTDEADIEDALLNIKNKEEWEELQKAYEEEHDGDLVADLRSELSRKDFKKYVQDVLPDDVKVLYKIPRESVGNFEETYEGDEFYEVYGWIGSPDEDQDLWEAEYRGRKVKLNKPMRGDVKKFKVYVKNKKGNVIKVNFGDPNMKIKKSNPARRRSFRARHNCDNPGPKTKARYWSCRKW